MHIVRWNIKTRNCMVIIFALEELFCTGNYLINKRPLHLTTLAFVDEKLMALQEIIDKKNKFLFI